MNDLTKRYQEMNDEREQKIEKCIETINTIQMPFVKSHARLRLNEQGTLTGIEVHTTGFDETVSTIVPLTRFNDNINAIALGDNIFVQCAQNIFVLVLRKRKNLSK